MPTPLRVLLVEDSEDDALLLINELENAGYEPAYDRVDTPEAMAKLLNERKWDIIISDYVMPRFSGLAALALAKEKTDAPVIIVSGKMGEDTAVEAMRAGARDYILKTALSRLAPAIERELREAEIRKERKRAEEELDSERRRLITVLETLPVGVAISDINGRLIEMNEAMRLIWGGDIPLAKNVSEYSIYEAWLPGTYKRLEPQETPLARALSVGEVIIGETFDIKRLDGSHGAIYVSAAPLRDAEGNITGGIVINEDITELVKLRRSLEDSLRQIRDEFDKEREYSLLLQRALMPAKPEISRNYRVAVEYVPAFASREIGGDFYDIFKAASGRAGILIGDVSGKGLEAAALAATTRSTIHAYAHETASTSDIMTRANSAVCAYQREMDSFVTVFFASLDTSNGHISYSNAGHLPALVHRSDGTIDELAVAQVPICVIERQDYREAEAYLEPGDKLILYTEGVIEARRDSQVFGEEGLRHALRSNGRQPAADVVTKVLEAARKWAGGDLSDDAVIVVIERLA